MPRPRGGGRIRPEHRLTNNDVAILGSDLTLPVELAGMYHETKKYAMSYSCRRNYRCRLRRVAQFWKDNDPEYYEIGVVAVSEEDRNDPSKYFFDGDFKTDLKYEGMNVQFVIHFFAKRKKKTGGKLRSWDDMRKFKDAILWGAKMANELLPISFFSENEKFLGGYKKEHRVAKSEGNVDESAADPISMDLFVLLLTWALEANNVLVCSPEGPPPAKKKQLGLIN
jgi:hypothetical protein